MLKLFKRDTVSKQSKSIDKTLLGSSIVAAKNTRGRAGGAIMEFTSWVWMV